jgi:hypothetical protein
MNRVLVSQAEEFPAQFKVYDGGNNHSNSVVHVPLEPRFAFVRLRKQLTVDQKT